MSQKSACKSFIQSIIRMEVALWICCMTIECVIIGEVWLNELLVGLSG